MTKVFPLWLFLSGLLLSGCGTASPSLHTGEDVARDEASTCEEPHADQCILLACDGEEGACGVFGCEDVDPDAVARTPLAHSAERVSRGAYRPPMRGPGSFRSWRRMGLREGARPRATFHFRYRFGYLPAFPRYEGKVVKHHLFPQAKEFREWFRQSGIDVHQYTLVIPEHLHTRIHQGDGRGGLWNEAWRQLHQAHPEVQRPEFLLRHAFELAFRYRLTGPIIPYHRPIEPIGPQLYGD